MTVAKEYYLKLGIEGAPYRMIKRPAPSSA
jgi:hypothetical protein